MALNTSNPKGPDSGASAAGAAGSEVTAKVPHEEIPPANIDIQIAPDGLKATLSIFPPDRLGGGDLSHENILRKWKDWGLDPEAFDYDAARAISQEWNKLRMPIEGKLVGEAVHLPMKGADARIEFIVDPNLKVKPADETGNVDFKSLSLIKPVRKGQPLARRIPAGKGAPGIDLFGKPCPAPDGADIDLPVGTNTEVASTDPNLVMASVAGFLQIKDGLLHVNECFVVDGSVDYSTGNIVYEQSAIIRGDIQDGFAVQVGAALEVGGGVGEAKVVCGGDVLVKKGFVGSGHGLITAKGNVTIGFVSNQSIRAHGGVTLEKESFNSQLYSRKGITVYGPLVGGSAMAFTEIICRVAGNDLGTKTEIEAGMDYILFENKHLLEEKLKELTAHLQKISQRMTRFREGYRTRKRFTAAEAQTMLELRDMQEKIQANLPELERRKLDIVERIRQGYQREGIRVRVEKKVNPGVVIKVGPECLRIQEEISGPKVFLYQLGRIKII
jgi:uncharacterized protein (DUF342 family)